MSISLEMAAQLRHISAQVVVVSSIKQKIPFEMLNWLFRLSTGQWGRSSTIAWSKNYDRFVFYSYSSNSKFSIPTGIYLIFCFNSKSKFYVLTTLSTNFKNLNSKSQQVVSIVFSLIKKTTILYLIQNSNLNTWLMTRI